MKFDSLYELTLSNLLLEGVTYKPPTDPSKLMADFYMLEYISSLDFNKIAAPGGGRLEGLPSAIRGEDFKEDIVYAKETLYPYLKDIILKDTFKALACEGLYALDIAVYGGMGDKQGKFKFEDVPEWVFKLLNVLKDYKEGDNDDTYEIRYTNTINFLRDNNIDFSTYVYFIKNIFLQEEAWSKGYGGEAWSNIAEAWLKLNSTSDNDLQSIAVYIDHIYDLEHNNGTVFNKIKRYFNEPGGKHFYKKEEIKDFGNSIYHGFGWITELLDFKAAVKNPFDLIGRTSNLMKKLASPAIKAAGFKRETMQNPDEQYHFSKNSKSLSVSSKEYWTDRYGKYNRQGEPAVIYYDNKNRKIKEEWYKHGLLHREGGPSEITYSYENSPIDFSKLYIDEPYVISKKYLIDGRFHRIDGPAISIIGKRNNQFSRLDYYYLYGTEVQENQLKSYNEKGSNEFKDSIIIKTINRFLFQLLGILKTNYSFNEETIKDNLLYYFSQEYPIVNNKSIQKYLIKRLLNLLNQYQSWGSHSSTENDIVYNTNSFEYFRNDLFQLLKKSLTMDENDPALYGHLTQ